MTDSLHKRRSWHVVSGGGPLIACAAASLMAVAAAQTTPTPDLSGAWEGQMLLGGNWRFMEAQFGHSGNIAEAKVDLPQDRREFQDFTAQGNQLRWALVRGQGRVRFDGLLATDVIRGRAEQNGVSGEFQLARIHRTAAREESRLAATYQTSAGDLVSIARFDFGDGVDRLALMDVRRGYWGTLLPTGPDTYLLAPARSGRFPTDVRIAFHRDAGGMGHELAMTGAGLHVRARRLDSYESRDLSFTSGDVTLAGTVVRPRARGPHPAVVMVHSSGNQSRNGPVAYFRLIANLFATNGIATLVYDKRGVGQSTGSWPTASYDDLARDVRAAVSALRGEKDLEPDRIGLWSLSQGGWVVPLVAAQDARIAFLSLVSAAATTPAQQEVDRVATVMKSNGSSLRDIESATRYLHTYFDVVANRQGWDAMAAAIASTASESWIQYVPRPRSAREVGWTPEPATLDPAVVFRKVTVPVLTVHGAGDLDVVASKNSPLFARMSTHPASHQRVFEGADHYLLLGVTDPDREHRKLSPGYLQLMIDWIKRVSRRR